MELRATARWLRDKTPVGDAFRLPLVLLKQGGLRFPRRAYQHFGSRGEFEVRVPGAGSFRWISRGHAIENCVFWDGIYAYEGESIRAWIQLARASRVIFDIGANTGLFTLTAGAASPEAQIFAFEPVPRIAQALRTNVQLNPALHVQVVEKAVGSQNGTANIFDPGGDNAYSASLNDTFLDAEKTSYPVEVIRISDFAASQGVVPDLIKLDVEGVEPAALEGMKDLLARHRPALMLEVLPRSSDDLIQQLAALTALGYSYFHLTDRGLVESKTVDRPQQSRNVLLSPRDRLPAGLLYG